MSNYVDTSHRKTLWSDDDPDSSSEDSLELFEPLLGSLFLFKRLFLVGASSSESQSTDWKRSSTTVSLVSEIPSESHTRKRRIAWHRDGCKERMQRTCTIDIWFRCIYIMFNYLFLVYNKMYEISFSLYFAHGQSFCGTVTKNGWLEILKCWTYCYRNDHAKYS